MSDEAHGIPKSWTQLIKWTTSTCCTLHPDFLAGSLYFLILSPLPTPHCLKQLPICSESMSLALIFSVPIHFLT